MIIRNLLLGLHIACIAAWLGAMLPRVGRIRRALQRGGTAARDEAIEAWRAWRLGGIFGGVVVVTGFGLIWNMGGFAAAPRLVHLGLVLTVVMLALEAGVIRPALEQLVAETGEGGNPSRCGEIKTRLAVVNGILQLLWLIVLALMIVKV